MSEDRIRTRIEDAIEDQAIAILYVGGDLDDQEVLGLSAAITALSTAHVVGVTRETDLSGPDVGPGGAGPYSTVADLAILLFETEQGASYKFAIGSPLDTIFEADTVTVDISVQVVAVAIAAILADCKTSTGVPMAKYLRGYRASR